MLAKDRAQVFSLDNQVDGDISSRKWEVLNDWQVRGQENDGFKWGHVDFEMSVTFAKWLYI